MTAAMSNTSIVENAISAHYDIMNTVETAKEGIAGIQLQKLSDNTGAIPAIIKAKWQIKNAASQMIFSTKPAREAIVNIMKAIDTAAIATKDNKTFEEMLTAINSQIEVRLKTGKWPE